MRHWHIATVSLHGDRAKAQRYIGVAKRALRRLQSRIETGLAKSNATLVRINDEVNVLCHVAGDVNVLRIIARPTGGEEQFVFDGFIIPMTVGGESLIYFQDDDRSTPSKILSDYSRGRLDWSNGDDAIVTWAGPPSRYWTKWTDLSTDYGLTIELQRRVKNTVDRRTVTASGFVLGAAYKDGVLYAIISDSATPSVASTISLVQWEIQETDVGAETVLATHDGAAHGLNPWFFNEAVTEAVHLYITDSGASVNEWSAFLAGTISISNIYVEPDSNSVNDLIQSSDGVVYAAVNIPDFSDSFDASYTNTITEDRRPSPTHGSSEYVKSTLDFTGSGSTSFNISESFELLDGDGNVVVQGTFDGTLNASIDWSGQAIREVDTASCETINKGDATASGELSGVVTMTIQGGGTFTIFNGSITWSSHRDFENQTEPTAGVSHECTIDEWDINHTGDIQLSSTGVTLPFLIELEKDGASYEVVEVHAAAGDFQVDEAKKPYHVSGRVNPESEDTEKGFWSDSLSSIGASSSHYKGWLDGGYGDLTVRCATQRADLASEGTFSTSIGISLKVKNGKTTEYLGGWASDENEYLKNSFNGKVSCGGGVGSTSGWGEGSTQSITHEAFTGAEYSSSRFNEIRTTFDSGSVPIAVDWRDGQKSYMYMSFDYNNGSQTDSQKAINETIEYQSQNLAWQDGPVPSFTPEKAWRDIDESVADSSTNRRIVKLMMGSSVIGSYSFNDSSATSGTTTKSKDNDYDKFSGTWDAIFVTRQSSENLQTTESDSDDYYGILFADIREGYAFVAEGLEAESGNTAAWSVFGDVIIDASIQETDLDARVQSFTLSEKPYRPAAITTNSSSALYSRNTIPRTESAVVTLTTAAGDRVGWIYKRQKVSVLPVLQIDAEHADYSTIDHWPAFASREELG